MIIPCIDLMGGKAVQLVQGREKVLEEDAPLNVLDRFKAFSELQIIDLDAAMGRGSNDALLELMIARTRARVGGGVRSVERARWLAGLGAHRIIIGTSAFDDAGPRKDFLSSLIRAVGRERIIIALDSKGGHIVVQGWRRETAFTAEDVIRQLEPYCAGFLCTYVDKEGTLQGTDLDWFRRLRNATAHEITAAGGITSLDEIRALAGMNVHAALGMAIYTGRLDLSELVALASKAAHCQ